LSQYPSYALSKRLGPENQKAAPGPSIPEKAGIPHIFEVKSRIPQNPVIKAKGVKKGESE
jgi:hypothetical protein